MNSIQTAYINALLADASYVIDLSRGAIVVSDFEKRLTPTQATYLAANFTVVASIETLTAGLLTDLNGIATVNSARPPALPTAPTASRCPSTHARHSPRKRTEGVRTQIGSRHCGQRRRAWVRGGDSLHARCEAKGSEPVECVVRGGQA